MLLVHLKDRTLVLSKYWIIIPTFIILEYGLIRFIIFLKNRRERRQFKKFAGRQ